MSVAGAIALLKAAVTIFVLMATAVALWAGFTAVTAGAKTAMLPIPRMGSFFTHPVPKPAMRIGTNHARLYLSNGLIFFLFKESEKSDFSELLKISKNEERVFVILRPTMCRGIFYLLELLG